MVRSPSCVALAACVFAMSVPAAVRAETPLEVPKPPGGLALELTGAPAVTFASYRYSATYTTAVSGGGLPSPIPLGQDNQIYQRPLLLLGGALGIALRYPFSPSVALSFYVNAGAHTVLAAEPSPLGSFGHAWSGAAGVSLDLRLASPDGLHFITGLGGSLLALQRSAVGATAPATVNGPMGPTLHAGLLYEVAGTPLTLGARLETGYLRDNVSEVRPAEGAEAIIAAAEAVRPPTVGVYNASRSVSGIQEIIPVSLALTVGVRLGGH